MIIKPEAQAELKIIEVTSHIVPGLRVSGVITTNGGMGLTEGFKEGAASFACLCLSLCPKEGKYRQAA